MDDWMGGYTYNVPVEQMGLHPLTSAQELPVHPINISHMTQESHDSHMPCCRWQRRLCPEPRLLHNERGG